jgi:hypothetical protein
VTGADEVVGRRLDPDVGRVADPVGLGEEGDLGDRLGDARGEALIDVAAPAPGQ